MQIEYLNGLEHMSDNGITEEYIDHELRKMHKKMMELFQVDFPYFKDIKILTGSEVREYITGRIRTKLKEKGVDYTNHQWMQIKEHLTGDTDGEFFKNMTFYNENEEILYLNQNILLNYPEKIMPICVHELAEKLISTIIHQPSITEPATNLLVKYINFETPDKNKRLEFLKRYKEIVFISVLKEGCCEAIALKTLQQSDLKDKAASIERELEQGHSKWIGILIALESMTEDKENQHKVQSIKKEKIEKLERELVNNIIKSSQVIKSVSYHLGYPIAKKVIDRYGIVGIKAAFNNPPLKAEFFINPSIYLSSLEIKNAERRLTNEKRRN